MTIQNLRKKYYKKIDSFDFDILVSLVLKKPRVFVLTYPEKNLTKRQVEKLIKLIKRRCKNEPLAYLIGEKEFYSNKFIVNKDVLVPRPETEMMVDEAIQFVTQNTKHITIIDIGTGSACVIVSLAKKLKKRKNIDFYGLDISVGALRVARKNAKLNSVDKKIKFIKSDLLSSIQSLVAKSKSKIIITANLPYLTAKQIRESPSIKKEPRMALVAGCDGLKYYRTLFKQINIIEMGNSLSDISLLCEIDPSQEKSIIKLAKQTLGTDNLQTVHNDLSGRVRMVVFSKKKSH